jgi:hypothetical protein
MKSKIKINYTKESKKLKVKKELIREQLKIWFDLCSVAGHNIFFSKNKKAWVYRLFWNVFSYIIKIISVNKKSLSKHLMIIYVNK